MWGEKEEEKKYILMFNLPFKMLSYSILTYCFGQISNP